MRGPCTTRHYPNLPANQHAVQRLADEFNAAEREWDRKHPAKPQRPTRRKRRPTIETVETATTQQMTSESPSAIGFQYVDGGDGESGAGKTVRERRCEDITDCDMLGPDAAAGKRQLRAGSRRIHRGNRLTGKEA